jgi:hypothetical protein
VTLSAARGPYCLGFGVCVGVGVGEAVVFLPELL